MNRGDSASPYSVRRSRRPQARLETSCTRTGRPRRHLRPSLAARRRAKAQAVRPACTSLRSHTAEYYLLLPMNHSNKDGKPLAESAGERPLIKENARQPNTYPTQSGKGVSQGLAGVRKAAKDRPNLQQQSPVRVGDFGPGLWTFLSRSWRLRPSLLSGTVPPPRSWLFVACDFRARRFLARETPNTTVQSCAACTLNNRVDCVDA
jgi:hypothetical protein